jgi:hypothetical protein
MENIHAANAATDFLRAACGLPLDEPDQITVLRLGIRMINAAGSAGEATLSGFYEPAASQVRDLIEVGFLLDLFRREPGEVTRWRELEDKERRKQFSAFELRTRLDKLDGFVEKQREAAYNFFTKHGTHVDPKTIVLSAPNMMSMVGPFPNRDRVVALSFEIARYYLAGAQYLRLWLSDQTGKIPPDKARALIQAGQEISRQLQYMGERKTDPRATTPKASRLQALFRSVAAFVVSLPACVMRSAAALRWRGL